MTAREAAVAGLFYPDEPAMLRHAVADCLDAAPPAAEGAKVIVAPHAGYPYSGPTAAHAYRQLEARRDRIERVVMLGPAHRVYLSGMALPSVDAFATPLGDVPVDRAGIECALALPGTELNDAAHADEHCLEVHLPFLQTVLDEFCIVPIVVGACPAPEVRDVLDALWGGEETAILVSSDLSHYHSYDAAREIDAKTSSRIEARDPTLRGEEACGAHALNGLLLAARSRGFEVRTLDLRNSGDTAGDRRRVVGYGAYALA